MSKKQINQNAKVSLTAGLKSIHERNSLESLLLENKNNVQEDSILQTEYINSQKSNNYTIKTLLLIVMIYCVFTALINFKDITGNYGRVLLNDIKDLIYWCRYSIGCVGVTYISCLILGINLGKEIREKNFVAMIFAISVLALSAYFGQKLFS
jgi:hypothetical protein